MTKQQIIEAATLQFSATNSGDPSNAAIWNLVKSLAELIPDGGGGSQDLDSVLTQGNSAGSQKIADLLDPTLDQDASTKKYVDDNAGGGGSIFPAGTKVYVALLTQSGINAPVATVPTGGNTLGGTVVWTRNDIGDYRGTLAGAFPLGKTFPFISAGTTETTEGQGYGLRRLSDNVIILNTGAQGSLSDDYLNSQPILILVFP